MAATSSLSSCSIFLFLIFTLSAATVPYANARSHAALFSTSSLVHRSKIEHQAMSENVLQALLKMHWTRNALMISKALTVGNQEDDDAVGVVRSTPAHEMPAYKQRSAPIPLPEFPTVGPPIVWSFPATPLPAVEAAPPPQDIPALPKTGSKNIGGPPPSCGGRDAHLGHPGNFPPSVPYVAAEPAVMPGPLQAPEGAPEPTAGGPLLPPYY